MTVIVAPKRTTVAGKVPTMSDLAEWEMGVNLADRAIYVRGDTEVVRVAADNYGGTHLAVPAFTNVSYDGKYILLDSPGEATRLLLGQVADWKYGPPLVDSTGLPGNQVLASGITGSMPSYKDLSADYIKSGVFDPARIPYEQDYIHGFYISTTSTTITVSAGKAYMPNLARVVESSGTVITSSRSANTVYHLYINSVGNITRVTSGPGAPYYLTARRQGTNNGTRYLGSVATNSSGNYYLQKNSASSNLVVTSYLYNIKSDGLVLSNGVATATTDVPLNTRMPTTATAATVILQNNTATSGGVVRVYNWDGSSFGVYTNIPNANDSSMFVIPVDDTPKFRYDTVAGGVAWAWLCGYTYER